MGRVDAGGLEAQADTPLPRAVAERMYEERAEEVNPGGHPETREEWIREHSFNAHTYQELFTLPGSESDAEMYYATSFADVRLVSLFATRIWRSPDTDEDVNGAYREASGHLGDPDQQGWGRFIFEPIAQGTAQHEWLRRELRSEASRTAKYRVVMLHYPLHTLGENVVPPFTDPVRHQVRGPDGATSFIGYEYPREADHLIRDVKPLLEEAGVDLVLNGHSHVWNRFEGATGVNCLETSNVGDTSGAYTRANGQERPIPSTSWETANYAACGDPGGLEPVVPTVNPVLDAQRDPLPYVASNTVTAFSILDTGTGTVTGYGFDTTRPDSQVFVLDRFSLRR